MTIPAASRTENNFALVTAQLQIHKYSRKQNFNQRNLKPTARKSNKRHFPFGIWRNRNGNITSKTTNPATDKRGTTINNHHEDCETKRPLAITGPLAAYAGRDCAVLQKTGQVRVGFTLEGFCITVKLNCSKKR